MDSVDDRRASSCQGSRWLATVQLPVVESAAAGRRAPPHRYAPGVINVVSMEAAEYY
eukprot:COSAG01_NODE_9222_length_2514_cov_1.659213_2_plen_57_part_00